MLKAVLKYTLLFLSISLFVACSSKFSKIKKKGTFQEKYDAATSYYEKKDYYRSGILFEDILPQSKGKKEAETTLLYLAYTHFYQKSYIMASYHFRNFFETYPRSELVEEAMFMRAKSLYKISPKSSLDQASSEKAISAFQNYINKYPSSIHAIEVNQKMDELQEKLEYKTYNITKLYHKIGYYKAAVIAIENFRVGFPDSHYNEELQYLKIESQYLLAKNSLSLVQDEDGNLVHLKKDRLNQAKKFYFNFIDSYPNSKFTVEAQGILEEIDTKLNNLG